MQHGHPFRDPGISRRGNRGYAPTSHWASLSTTAMKLNFSWRSNFGLKEKGNPRDGRSCTLGCLCRKEINRFYTRVWMGDRPFKLQAALSFPKRSEILLICRSRSSRFDVGPPCGRLREADRSAKMAVCRTTVATASSERICVFWMGAKAFTSLFFFTSTR